MPPKQWTTDAQLAYLCGHKNAFLEGQKKKNLRDFWVDVERDWFRQWPEDNLIPGPDNPEYAAQLALHAEAVEKRKKVSFQSVVQETSINMGLCSNSKRGLRTTHYRSARP